jgi:ATP-dependent helicase/nuclease subunit A
MAPGSEKEDCEASQAARTARQARVDAETLRLLYVALTRARDRIVILGRASGKAALGYDEGSWWAVLAETFERLGSRVRDIGDGRRRLGRDPTTQPVQTVVPSDAIVLPDWAGSPPRVDPNARLASPSRMADQAPIPAPSPLSIGAGGLGRFRRGDLIHRLLERLPEIAPDQRADAASRMMSRERDLTDDQRGEMIAAALSILDDARFAPVFGPGSRAEVALTGSAPALPPGVAISGRIDRLVITPDRVLVVDYKTNRPAVDRVEDVDPAYVLQMATYVAVLKRLYPDRAVEAALVWTDGPKLMAVPASLMDTALARAR